MIIGVLGKKNSGKDTVADYLVQYHKFKKISFAEPVKEICKLMFGFNHDQLYGNEKEAISEKFGFSPRMAMQTIGTDLFRNDIVKYLPSIEDKCWIYAVKNKIDNIRNEDTYQHIVISDVRFQNELNFVHQLNGKIIKLIRGESKNDFHSSEDIDSVVGYDTLIINDYSFDDLYKEIDVIMDLMNKTI